MQEISMMVVEDEAITLEFLCSTLAVKYPGATIHKALDGEEGLELFEAYSPQIIITDLNMPGMDGKQMAARIQKIRPETKFIALTGLIFEKGSEESAGNGFQFEHYIVKPLIIKDLFSAVDQCISALYSGGN